MSQLLICSNATTLEVVLYGLDRNLIYHVEYLTKEYNTNNNNNNNNNDRLGNCFPYFIVSSIILWYYHDDDDGIDEEDSSLAVAATVYVTVNLAPLNV